MNSANIFHDVFIVAPTALMLYSFVLIVTYMCILFFHHLSYDVYSISCTVQSVDFRVPHTFEEIIGEIR